MFKFVSLEILHAILTNNPQHVTSPIVFLFPIGTREFPSLVGYFHLSKHLCQDFKNLK